MAKLALTVIPRGRNDAGKLLFTVHARFDVGEINDWPDRLVAGFEGKRLELFVNGRWEPFDAELKSQITARGSGYWRERFGSGILKAAAVPQTRDDQIPVRFNAFGEYDADVELERLQERDVERLFNMKSGATLKAATAANLDRSGPALASLLSRVSELRSPPAVLKQATPPEPFVQSKQEELAALSDSPTLMRELGLVFDLWISSEYEALKATRVRVAEKWALKLANAAASNELPLLETEMRVVEGHGYFAGRFSGADLTNSLRDALGADATTHGPFLETWAPADFSQNQSGEIGSYRISDGADPVRASAKRLLAEERVRAGELGAIPAEQTRALLGLKPHSDTLLRYATARQKQLLGLLESLPNANPNPNWRRLDVLDLIKGFRPYVCARRDDNREWGNWRSLCRSGADVGNLRVPDEDGCVELPVATRLDDKDQGYTSDVYFVWQNWPLCAPPLFESLPKEEGDLGATGVSVTRSLSKSYAIPPLRFGYQYSFCVLAVTITGDLFGPGPAIGRRGANASTFRRADPALPPEIVHPTRRRLKVPQPDDAVGEAAKATAELRHDIVVSKEMAASDEAAEANHSRWLVAPSVDSTLFELAGGLDKLPDFGYQLLRESDPAPGQVVDTISQRLADPAVVGVIVEVNGESKRVPFADVGNGKAVRIMAVTSSGPRLRGPGELSRGLVGVYIPKGEEVLVKIRSLLDKTSHAHFRIAHQYRDVRAKNNAAPGDGTCDVANPLDCVQPMAELHILRPTSEPVAAPLIREVRVVPRSLGELKVVFQLALDAHLGSSELLQLEGSWTEYTDTARGLTKSVKTAQLGELKVPTTLWDGKRDPTRATSFGTPEANSFSHAFADGRHRILELTLRAIAPERFAAALGAKLIPGSKASYTYRFSLLNTQRPRPIEIDEVVPILRARTSRGGRRKQQSWGLRIYMKHGFMESGPGELVAVLGMAESTSPGNGASTSPPLAKRWVTQFGADPLAGAVPSNARQPRVVDRYHAPANAEGDVKGPPFLGRRRDRRNRKSATPLRVAPPVRLRLPEEGFADAVARPHRAKRTHEGRWYVDVEIDSGDYYFPFARLSIARYQPNSIEEAMFSEPTLLEFIQVPSGRHVTKRGVGAELHFSVSGPGRADNSIIVSLFEAASGAIDYAKTPAPGDLVLDEVGLWQPVVRDGKAITQTLAWDPSRSEFRSETGPLVVPFKHAGPSKPKRWRVLIEETESYRDTEGNDVRRVVWFAVYDSKQGFGRNQR